MTDYASLIARVNASESPLPADLLHEVISALKGQDYRKGIYYGAFSLVFDEEPDVYTIGWDGRGSAPDCSIDDAIRLILSCPHFKNPPNCHGYDASPKYTDAYVSRNNTARHEHWMVQMEHASAAIAFLLSALEALRKGY